MTAAHAPVEAPAAGPLATEPSPVTIMQVASGFMAAKHLFAANELGLFEALGDSPADLDPRRPNGAHPPGGADKRRRDGGARAT
jgi:hypothetical protein